MKRRSNPDEATCAVPYGSWLWRRSTARVLGQWVFRGDWSRDDAERVVHLVAGDNARRVYGLPPA